MEYLSLVNILAKGELVPEFMPYLGSIEPIVKAIEQLLEDRDRLIQISDKLIQLAEPLGQAKASERVAEIAVKMLLSTDEHREYSKI